MHLLVHRDITSVGGILFGAGVAFTRLASSAMAVLLPERDSVGATVALAAVAEEARRSPGVPDEGHQQVDLSSFGFSPSLLSFGFLSSLSESDRPPLFSSLPAPPEPDRDRLWPFTGSPAVLEKNQKITEF